MLSRDPIKFAHVTLGLVPKILDAIDVISSLCKELRMIDREVLERADIKRVVAPPAVKINNAVGRHFTFNDGYQRLPSRIWDHACVNFSTKLK